MTDFLDKMILITGAALIAAFGVFLLVLLGTIWGMFVGWLVGLFFSNTLLPIFAAIGLKGFALWEIGGFLGFVGGFFRTAVTQKAAD